MADFETAAYGVHALYPHSRHLAAKVRVLVEFLAERYRGSPSWEAGLVNGFFRSGSNHLPRGLIIIRQEPGHLFSIDDALPRPFEENRK